MEHFLKSKLSIGNHSYLRKHKRKGKIDNQASLKLPRHPIIVEAGAHIGVDSIEMAILWPEGHIYAFEPVKGHLSKLIENTMNHSNIIVTDGIGGS